MRHDNAVLQDRLLPGVSRTFALTIPQLPKPLRETVTNAYLLCRIADTIEDDIALDAATKSAYHRQFVEVVRGQANAVALARNLHAQLSGKTPAAERELVRRMPKVVDITHDLKPRQRSALQRCIETMCTGMPEFQRAKTIAGLDTLGDLNQYCYTVAGVVGEMLTELFCDHSSAIAERRQPMMMLAVAFGQGLQMTNILKDFWEDRAIQACWLPREIFSSHGLDLTEPDSAHFQQRFSQGLKEIIGIAHACLKDALRYVRLIPRGEVGIRRFCLWSIGLAVLTLQNIRRNPHYRSGAQVKVSRLALKATILLTKILSKSNAALQLTFNLSTSGLPTGPHLPPSTRRGFAQS